MKIIEYGYIKPKVRVCRFCKCKFEWVPRDSKELRHIRYVRCPICGAANVLREDEIGE